MLQLESRRTPREASLSSGVPEAIHAIRHTWEYGHGVPDGGGFLTIIGMTGPDAHAVISLVESLDPAGIRDDGGKRVKDVQAFIVTSYELRPPLVVVALRKYAQRLNGEDRRIRRDGDLYTFFTGKNPGYEMVTARMRTGGAIARVAYTDGRKQRDGGTVNFFARNHDPDQTPAVVILLAGCTVNRVRGINLYSSY